MKIVQDFLDIQYDVKKNPIGHDHDHDLCKERLEVNWGPEHFICVQELLSIFTVSCKMGRD